MSRKAIALVVMVAMLGLIVAVAGLVWGAKAMTPNAGRTHMAPGATATRPSGARGGDFTRCPETCNTLMRYYGEKRPTLTVHEGDKRCWQACDSLFNKGKNARNTAAMKQFWMSKRDANLHVNQCAQACWQRFHGGSYTVPIAGMRSTPRAWAYAPGERRMASAR